MKKIGRLLARFAALACFLCAGYAWAEEERALDHTITLTKVVDVYEFEDLKVSVGSYDVAPGDSLIEILKSRGLEGDEARLLRLVKNLNPDLRDPNLIQPGQRLNLPMPLREAERAREGAAPPSETEASEPPFPDETAMGAPPVGSTDEVKIYERRQSGQEPALVVVMRHRPPDGGASPGPEEKPAAAPSSPSSSALDFPSGNHGPLAMEPDTRVVYRTVKIRRGDTLERLLRREGMDNGLIYAHLLKVTLELNPEIKNQDLIYAGAELRIPAAGDYLAGLAGVNPAYVREAALARSLGRAPAAPERRGERSEALRLPAARAEAARNTLGLIFTRLGGKLDMRGRLVLPSGGGSLEFNTAEVPLIEFPSGRRLALDMEARLSRRTLRGLSELPDFYVFRPARGESFEQALARLWPMAGFYRVRTKNQPYEGGTDIKLAIAADFLIWPTQESWNNGSPLALNLAGSPERKTDPRWKSFLSGHGIEILDIHEESVLPDAPPARPGELKITRLDEPNPSLLAAQLVEIMGAEPKVGLQLDAPAPAGEGAGTTAPVLWMDGGRQVVLDFGDLDPEAVKTMREEGYRVVSAAGKGPLEAIEAVMEGFGLAGADSLVLKAAPGGPAMSISIGGRLFEKDGRRLFFTAVDMPEGISALLPDGLEIFRY